MLFCIRDDDTSFFTTPEELESAYCRAAGPVSLAIVPFCRSGRSKGVPERYRGTWTVHPLHENKALVAYLRSGIASCRYEVMLHGYHHDEADGLSEFGNNRNLAERVADGRKYLEDVLATRIRVFVPPWNSIRRTGLRAVVGQKLHLGGAAGVRGGWPVTHPRTWATWLRLRRWEQREIGIPYVLDMGDHREIPCHAVTPVSRLQRNKDAFETAYKYDGVFCAATHYWEFDVPSAFPDDPPVRKHLQCLIDLATSRPGVEWKSVGDAIAAGKTLL